MFIRMVPPFLAAVLLDDAWAKPDRKSTRLNSSHDQISYAVFCLKKKKTTDTTTARAKRKQRHAPKPHASNNRLTLYRHTVQPRHAACAKTHRPSHHATRLLTHK